MNESYYGISLDTPRDDLRPVTAYLNCKFCHRTFERTLFLGLDFDLAALLVIQETIPFTCVECNRNKYRAVHRKRNPSTYSSNYQQDYDLDEGERQSYQIEGGEDEVQTCDELEDGTERIRAFDDELALEEQFPGPERHPLYDVGESILGRR